MITEIKEKYTSLYFGLCGRFEILSDGEENTLIQIAEPDDNRDKIFPVTVLGDDSWSDYSVKIEVKLSDEDILNYAWEQA